MKWVCSVCGYVYEGAEPPEKCPVCGAPKAKFVKMDEERVYADEHRVGVARGLDQRIVDGLRMNFTGECSEVGMYLAMARQADREGYPEVAEAFKRYAYEEADQLGLTTEHYIISSGLKEIIEGTAIADYFKRIYAAEFLYDGTGAPVWPAMAVNYTSKTQFLYRINKGVLGVTQNEELNRHTPHNTRRVPFTNMMYLGDGLTDVPCMKLTKSKGGHSIAVYQGKRDRLVNDMLVQGRVDFAAPADYRESGLLETIVFSLLDQLAPQNRMDRIAASQLDEAQAAIIQEDRLAFRDAPD